MAKRARIIVVGCSLFGCAVAQALLGGRPRRHRGGHAGGRPGRAGARFRRRDAHRRSARAPWYWRSAACAGPPTWWRPATDDDASNLLIAELASEIFGVPHVLPLVDDDALADILDDMGIAPICPHRICEDEFFRLTGLTRKEADL